MDVGLIKEEGVLGETETYDDENLTIEDVEIHFDNEKDEIGIGRTPGQVNVQDEVDEKVAINKILELYPIPARDRVNLKINIDIENQAKIELISSEGQILETFYKDNFKGIAHEIDVRSLLPGFYYVRVTDGNEIYFKKFVVQ